MEKETDKKFAKGFYLAAEYCGAIADKRSELVKIIDGLLNEDVIFSKEEFMCFWMSGLIKRWNICKTKEAYINTVSKYIGLYGKALEKDTIMFKAVEADEEIFGGSWTKDIKSARNFAVKYLVDTIVSTVIPKGTKTIHFHPNFRFKESEDLIDTTKVLHEPPKIIARLKELSFTKDGRAVGIFENEGSGCRFAHMLDVKDSYHAANEADKIRA